MVTKVNDKEFSNEIRSSPRNDPMLNNPNLQVANIEIERLASKLHLDFFPTIFEVVSEADISEFGAYGLPARFGHWTFGRAFQTLSAQHQYGLARIMEMVINNNPAYAFLLEKNTLTINKMVMGHVLGHVDFFKNNFMFKNTSRHEIDVAGFHARQIQSYEHKYGRELIEKLLDAALSIQYHIDPIDVIRGDRLFAKPLPNISEQLETDDWVTELNTAIVSPKDLLGNIIAYATNLKPYEKHILSFIRSEMLYFAPQAATKIMNEGWATYWHLKLMQEYLSEGEFVEFAKHHAAVIAQHPVQINPYRMGLMIFQDIEARWDKDYGEGEGIKKILEVREIDNDVSFIRNYLTDALCKKLNLFEYAKQGHQWVVTNTRADKVRNTLIRDISNMGRPIIVVADRDYKSNRELVLVHNFEGVPLKSDYAESVLTYIYGLWDRTTHLWTAIPKQNGEITKVIHMSYDGKKITREEMETTDKIPENFYPGKSSQFGN